MDKVACSIILGRWLRVVEWLGQRQLFVLEADAAHVMMVSMVTIDYNYLYIKLG